MSQLLNNKIILVTGAGSGIGRAVAISAAKSGATVILLSKNQKKLEQLYDFITLEYPDCPTPVLHPIDLLKITPIEAQKMVQGIESLFGSLHGIVHCAGIIGQLTPISHYPAHLWQEVLHLNLTVPFLLTQHCLPLLKAASKSHIVFTNADEGYQAKAYFGAYTCAKFGLTALTQTLRQELENHTTIQVHSINPKKVSTALRAKIYPSEDPDTLRTPQSVAEEYIQLLCS